MKALGVLAVMTAAAAVLAGCDQGTAERWSVEATRYYSDKVLHTDYDLRLIPVDAEASGPVVFTRTELTLADGKRLALRQVGTGVYRTPSLLSRRVAADYGLCGAQPVSYLTLHRGPQGLYYLNAGNWPSAPDLPTADERRVPGACETTAYRPADGA